MESLSGVRLPAHTWHAYSQHASKTLCGLPLDGPPRFDSLPFLPIRTRDVCRARTEELGRH